LGDSTGVVGGSNLDAVARAPSSSARGAGCAIDEVGASTERPAGKPLVDALWCCNPCCISFGKEGLTSSSQVNIEKSNAQIIGVTM
jgi:hypothetical protein